MIDKNPMKRIPRPKQKDEHKSSILTQENIKQMTQCPPELKRNGWSKTKEYNEKWRERDAAILAIFNCTGVRKTALCELNIEDVSFEDMIIHTVDKRDKVQDYDIMEGMMDVIAKWIAKREQILNGEPCDAFFITDNNRRMSTKTMYRIIQRYTKEITGVALSPHKLRGAFCEGTYERNNRDIEATMKAMGHSNIATTSIYIKNKNNSRRQAIDSASKFIFG